MRRIFKHHEAKRLLAQGICPQCQYDLTGNTSGMCPECGFDIAAGENAL